MNVPYVVEASSTGGFSAVTVMHGEPSTSYDVLFYTNIGCDPSGSGEGRTHVMTETTTTDAAGNSIFTASIATPVTPGHVVVACAIRNSERLDLGILQVRGDRRRVNTPVPPFLAGTPDPAVYTGTISATDSD